MPASLADLTDDPKCRAPVEGILAYSPYLTHAAISEPEAALKAVRDGPEAVLNGAWNDIRALIPVGRPESEVTSGLRRAKRRAALAIAVADLMNRWDVAEATEALSETADLCLQAAVAHALREAARRGVLDLDPEAPDPSEGSGLIVLAMGKLGARELNYSSDIDLIVLFDPDRMPARRPETLSRDMVRLTRLMVRLMDERTSDGYVFRTDLRLRPDPGATAIALSTDAALVYYESLGQNWERAAMIKARPAAGDLVAGRAFLDELIPFIWRKHLDFAAIEDIRSIKRQIIAHRGLAETSDPLGHNLKLGHGGIREIEFFVQTQQLIWGGRMPPLRKRSTELTLEKLVEADLCAEDTALDLKAAYRFLRRAEHRLQMINDEQTHTLPEDPEDLESYARFLGFENAAAFTRAFRHHVGRVRTHYAQLFDDSPSLGAVGEVTGNLVFTGADPDPGTLKTLSDMGFTAPEKVDTQIRLWHRGRYRSTRSERSRQLITELTPSLLLALSNTPEPDTAFIRFDRFLAGLPAGVQLFSLFQANPETMTMVVKLIGKAPRLARHMTAIPGVIDSVLSPGFMSPLPKLEDLRTELSRWLGATEDMEEKLLASRRWANEKRFQVGVQRLFRAAPPHTLSGDLADIAETVLDGLLTEVSNAFAERHGRIPGADVAILALGRLGSREMTASSDLDLIFVGDFDDPNDMSDGPSPLPPGRYFSRLTQRMINAITAMTPQGPLYEVDMRLRPSGNQGPIAVSLAAFERYQREEAWTWEHLALARARPVAGSPELKERLARIVKDVLAAPREPKKLLKDVANMRDKLANEKPATCLWDVKNLRGGLVDIAFITQYLLLKHAHEHPEILSANTWRVLDNLARAGLLNDADAELLKRAQDLWLAILGVLALTIEGTPTRESEETFSKALADDLSAAVGARDMAELRTTMETTAYEVLDVFDRLISRPAAAP